MSESSKKPSKSEVKKKNLTAMLRSNLLRRKASKNLPEDDIKKKEVVAKEL